MFAQNSSAASEFNYGAKDFTTYTFPSTVAGRGSADYSFKMESIGVYDNWVMTKDADGNATSNEYQKNPANWMNKEDADKKVGGGTEYKFRDSYNPFVQLMQNTHLATLDYKNAWSVNVSFLAAGEYNTVDFQAISNDTGGRVTMSLFSLNSSIAKTFGNFFV